MSLLAHNIKNAPRQPGCYLFKDRRGEIIYIGKAKDLRPRVSWYFKKENQVDKTAELVRRINNVEFIITDSELEALLLEAQLIRQHQPKYNVDLKAGVRYAYLMVTNEKFPRLMVTRTPHKRDKVFGPYTSGLARQEILRLAIRLFKLRTGKRLQKRDEAAGRIRLATAPWKEEITPAMYAQRVSSVELLLKGQSAELIEKLNREMKQFSSAGNFEQAKERRDQIFALQSISEKQKVQLRKHYDQDVINYVALPEKIVIQLFHINRGVISGRKEFRLPLPYEASIQDHLASFITQYYYANDIPHEILVPSNISDRALVEKYLAKLVGHAVSVNVPMRGNRKKLLALVQKNLEASVNVGDASLYELQRVLHLTASPRVIECFDISNLGATGVVASMVQFRDATPDKNNYRRFKIKTVTGQSDFDAMHEVVYRRYRRLKDEKNPLPDLVMVDGGKPQLSAARKALKELGLTLPLIALAKREEEIFQLGNPYPLRLLKTSRALMLLQRIRDEAHRFAITYQRVVRRKQNFKR